MVKRLTGSIILLLGLLFPLSTFGADIVVTIVDETGSPLAGARINLPGQKLPIIANADGQFRLSVASGKQAKIEASHIGFVTETFIVRGSDNKEMTIQMTPDPSSLEEVVVTATRTPKTLKEVPVVTRLISADDIKKADATNIQDLLTEELPGLEFGYAMSQETSLNMSGFGGNAVLFLVDGERLAGETMDNVDYNRLNLDNVGRVEVVKGASSALYGANAVGGVVNLITRESKEPWHANINSRYRSAGHEWRNGADINFNQGKWTSNTNVQYSRVSTIHLTDAFDTESKIHDIYGGNTLNIKERLVYRPTDNLRLIARGGYFNRVSTRSNYDDHYKDYNAGLKGVYTFNPHQTLELSYGYDQYDKSRYVGGQRTHDHDYTNRQNIVHGLYTHFFGDDALTVGADYMHDYLLTYQFADGTTHSQNSIDAFVQYDYNPVKWFNVVGSVRGDHFSASKEGAITSRLATMFKFDKFSIRASYAGGFRAPTLKEMYMSFDMAGIQMIYGNPDLKPEKSHNFNLAFEHNGMIRHSFLRGSYSLALMGYFNKYNSRITTTDYTGPDGEEGARYCNENGVKVMGIDFTGRYRSTMGLGAMVSYNFLHNSGRTIDSQFTKPRTHSATWRLDYDKQLCSAYRLYAGISGRYLSKPKSNYETDGAYSLWKFTLRQTVWRGIDVNFVIENLFDYKPKVYYWNSAPTTGRTWNIGVSFDIEKLFK